MTSLSILGYLKEVLLTLPRQENTMEKLNHSYDFLNSSVDGINLFYRSWLPTREITRVFVIQHGIGEHSGRYGNLIKALNNGHTAFYGIDSRGHGQSPGIRGHADHFSDYAEDLDALVEHVKNKYQSAKRYLFGHSMGGAIVLDYCLEKENQNKFDGLIVSAPALRPVMDPVKHVKKFLGTRLARFFPRTILDTGIDLNSISQDKDTIKAYKDDPLVHGKISFQIGKSLFEIGDKIMDQAHNINIPCYIFHGTRDELVSYEGSQSLYEKVSSAKKSLHLFDGLYHETLNEVPLERQKVLDNLVSWVSVH